MFYEYLIRMGQRLRSLSTNEELRQYIILAFLPMIVIAGYYLWQNHGEVKQPAQVLSVNSENKDTSSQNNKQEPAEDSSEEAKTIKVDISGAVVHPGLKELPDGARVDDALKVAGGLNNQADKQYIAQVLNLAQKLRDGDKIYLPTYYEVSLSIPAPVTLLDKANNPLKVLTNEGGDSNDIDDKSEEGSEPSYGGLVNINTAPQSELESLPGIGPVYAKKIIDHRPYTEKSEVCGKDVVNNSSTCDKIRDLITI